MRCCLVAVFTAMISIGVWGGESPKDGEPKAFTGKVVETADGKKKQLELKADNGKSYSIIDNAASKMLFLEKRLRDRPVQLTAILEPQTNSLRVVRVQTLKDGVLHDVDYWCEICQISLNYPGLCVCCNDDTVFRERPAR